MGINKNLIVGEIGKESCDCSICSNLLDDAVMLKCEHYFCRICITEMMEDDEAEGRHVIIYGGDEENPVFDGLECPDCDGTVLCYPKDITQPGRFVQNIMSLIKLKCPLAGCDMVLEYNMFHTHITECIFNPHMEVKCKHCNDTYKKVEEVDHIDGLYFC